MGYRLSPAARGDLEDIWDYTLERWGLTQAEIYLGGIREALDTVAGNPRLGRTCDEVRPGYRKWLVAAHVVYYRQVEADIDIVRILHGRMDVDRHV